MKCNDVFGTKGGQQYTVIRFSRVTELNTVVIFSSCLCSAEQYNIEQ